VKIAVIAANKRRMEEILHILQEGGNPRSILTFEGGIERLGPVADQEMPDLIVMEGLCQEKEELTAMESLGQRHPNMSLIILCENLSQAFLIQAMRVGVREVLPAPVSPQALLEAVARVEQKLVQVETQRHKGKVLAFIACKGGSGATFLASNLGYVLAAEHGKRVALFDLNLQFGDAALFVSDRPAVTTLSDVANNILRLDASLLASSMVMVLPNYGVLAAPENPAHAADVRPEHVHVLLALAAVEYDYVILDVGRNLDAVSLKALDRADLIFPVLQETLPFIRDAKRIISTLESLGYGKDKLRVIVNRYEKGGDIQLEDVERTLDMKVFAVFPNSYEAVSASVNQGVPIVKMSKRDPVSKTLLKIGKDLEQEETRESSWLGHLFGHS